MLGCCKVVYLNPKIKFIRQILEYTSRYWENFTSVSLVASKIKQQGYQVPHHYAFILQSLHFLFKENPKRNVLRGHPSLRRMWRILNIIEYCIYFSKIFRSHWVDPYFISLKSVVDFVSGHAVVPHASVSLAPKAFVIACRNRIASVLIGYWPTGVIYPFLWTVSSAVAT
jgi:hypothetical protein